MDDLKRLKAFRADLPGPDAARTERARTRLEEEISGRAPASSPARPRRLLPRTRLGWLLAALAALLFAGTGAYAVSEVSHDVFRFELPGAARGEDVGVPLDRGEAPGHSQTAHGAKVTLERVYADERNVVVGFRLEDLEADRRIDGFPAELSAGDAKLTDEAGTRFRYQHTSGTTGPSPVPNSVVFVAPEGIEPGENHRFRLEVPVQAALYSSRSAPPDQVRRFERLGEPSVLEFEAPVRPIPTIEVDEARTVGGVTLTLERIENSPGKPEAVVCFEPPDDKLDWVVGTLRNMNPRTTLEVPGRERPVDVTWLGGRKLGAGCDAVPLVDGGAGEYTLTVPVITGSPKGEEALVRAFREGKRPETVRGPWRFDFELPESDTPR